MNTEDPAGETQRIVAANTYLTLATAGVDGRPWATPVWFAVDGLDWFCWVSKPAARHSANIAVRPEVALVIFDSNIGTDATAAVYVEATAAEVGPGDRAAVLAVYNERSEARSLPAWTEAAVTDAARHRLYRAQVHRVWVLDEHDERVPVALSGD